MVGAALLVAALSLKVAVLPVAADGIAPASASGAGDALALGVRQAGCADVLAPHALGLLATSDTAACRGAGECLGRVAAGLGVTRLLNATLARDELRVALLEAPSGSELGRWRERVSGDGPSVAHRVGRLACEAILAHEASQAALADLPLDEPDAAPADAPEEELSLTLPPLKAAEAPAIEPARAENASPPVTPPAPDPTELEAFAPLPPAEDAFAPPPSQPSANRTVATAALAPVPPARSHTWAWATTAASGAAIVAAGAFGLGVRDALGERRGAADWNSFYDADDRARAGALGVNVSLGIATGAAAAAAALWLFPPAPASSP